MTYDGPIEAVAPIKAAEAQRLHSEGSGLERVVFVPRGSEALSAFEAALAG